MQIKKTLILQAFISCPSDVGNERAIAEEVCDQLNQSVLLSKGVEVAPIHWKKNVVPVITGDGAQAEIAKQIGEDYDIYIGIMWKRFGEKQENGLTPTEEEFNDALNRRRRTGKPVIQFYFKPVFCDGQDDYEENQIAEVGRFRQGIKDLGLYETFESEEDFREKLSRHIKKIAENFDFFMDEETLIPKISYPEIRPYLPRKVCPRKDYDSGRHLYFMDKYAKDTLDIITDCKLVALISDAGVGKTTELRRIAGDFSKDESPFYPFFVSLNKYVDQSLSELLPTGWEEVPKSKIVVILDGLDEIESKNKRDAIRQIELFAEQYPETHIVVSCRTNFYESETEQSSGTLSGFSSYMLLELGEKEIEDYVKGSLSQEAESFDKAVSNNRLHDLLKIPFYLVRLVELFKKNHSLPRHKAEIFKQLLANRIEQDIEHYRTTIPLRQKQTTIFQTLQKLALGMEILGRNYISNDEYCQIVEDEHSRELIEHCTVWKKDDSEELKWQFEHNNFQEYLAAKLLSTKPLIMLKEFMFFGPDYRKLIPSWSNTLSFLISISDKHDLIQWIMDNEPDLAVKCETDRIEIDTRINIFKHIFNHYKEKQIWINHDKFRYDELARFGQSDEIVEFLLSEAEKAEHYTTASSAIELLSHLEIPRNQRGHTSQLLVDYALGNSFGDQVQCRSLMALADLEMNSHEVVNKIAETLQTSDSEWTRYGLYYFLHNSDYLDDNIDIFLNGLQYARLDFSSTRSRLFDERWHLWIGLEKAKSPDSLMKILKYFAVHPQELSDTISEESISVIALNTANAYDKETALLQVVQTLLHVLVEINSDKQAHQLLVFFDKTETRLDVFREYLFHERNDTERWYIAALVANNECIELFVEQFEQGNLEDDDVLNFRNSLAWKNSDLYSPFDDLINTRTGNRFPLPQERDYKKERKERSQCDFDLLFDKDAFLNQIKLIYDTEGKESLTDKEILDVQHSHWNNPYFSNLAINQLRNLARESAVTYDDVVEAINKWDWDLFCISNLYEKLKLNKDIVLMQEQKKCVARWCYSKLAKVDFKNALETKTKESSSASWFSIFLWYFLRKLGLTYPKKVLLDMTSYDWIEGSRYVGIEYLETLVSKHDLTTRILQNLEDGIQNDDVLKNHFDYCKRHRIAEVLPFSMSDLTNSDRGEDVRKIALDTICSLSTTSQSDLEKALPQISDDFKWCVIEKLVENNSQTCREYLLALLKTADDEEGLRSAQRLIELHDLEGLKYYVDWIRTNKKAPEKTHFEKSPLSFLCALEAVPYLIELLKISYQPDFTKSDYDYFEQDVLDALAATALQSDENYQSVRRATEDFISENIGVIQNINFLNIFIEKLDRKYYVSKSEGLNITDVVTKLKTVLGS